MYYIVSKFMYSLIVRGWHNRSHFPIDTLHGIKYSLDITSEEEDSYFLFPDLEVSRGLVLISGRDNTQFAHLNKLSE